MLSFDELSKLVPDQHWPPWTEPGILAALKCTERPLEYLSVWHPIFIDPGLQDKGAEWVTEHAATLKQVAQNYKAQHGIFPHPCVAAALVLGESSSSSSQNRRQDVSNIQVAQSCQPTRKRAHRARETAITPSSQAPNSGAENMEPDGLIVTSQQHQVTPTNGCRVRVTPCHLQQLQDARISVQTHTVAEDLVMSGYLWYKSHGYEDLWEWEWG